jgi:hypothetical protein
VFYKNLPAREYKFLISEPDFNFNTLKKLLVNNELRDFDPVKEAFKVMAGLRGSVLAPSAHEARALRKGAVLLSACLLHSCCSSSARSEGW